MKSGLLALLVIVGLVLILIMGGCSSYNKMVNLSEGVDKQWAQVENAYQRRMDLIPNLVKTVEAEANFEKSTLTEITNARASVGQIRMTPGTAPDEATMQKWENAQNKLSGALSRLLVVSERYPDLKSNAAFHDLRVSLEGTENRINVERNRFNEAAMSYNADIKRMPAALYAGMFGFHPKAYFKSSAGAEEVPKVEFNFNKPAAPPVPVPTPTPAPVPPTPVPAPAPAAR